MPKGQTDEVIPQERFYLGQVDNQNYPPQTLKAYVGLIIMSQWHQLETPPNVAVF